MLCECQEQINASIVLTVLLTTVIELLNYLCVALQIDSSMNEGKENGKISQFELYSTSTCTPKNMVVLVVKARVDLPRWTGDGINGTLFEAG